MTTPTLILSARYTDDSRLLWKAALNKGWSVERLDGWRVTEAIRSASEPVLYLEALMSPVVAEALGLTLVEPAETALPDLPEEYRKRAVRLTTLGAARRGVLPAFIKSPNDKSFPAQVYEAAALPDFPDETPVLVAEVVRWEKEFRCFVLDRELKTYSIYERDGQSQRDNGFVSTDEEAAGVRKFMASLLSDARVSLPSAVVVDVGVIAGRGWAVVEFNAAWGAGIYGCDPATVLTVLRRAVINEGAPSSDVDRN